MKRTRRMGRARDVGRREKRERELKMKTEENDAIRVRDGEMKRERTEKETSREKGNSIIAIKG